jgi:hypothetical protein
MANILLQSCCYPGLQYYTDESNWTGATSAVTTVFSVTYDSVVVNGCYTIVSAFTSGFTSTSIVPDGVYTQETGCGAHFVLQVNVVQMCIVFKLMM